MQELYNNYGIDNKVWEVAIYARLSREDEKDEKFNGQSESIENQIKFLKNIVTSNGWILAGIYKDDGYTGTNFNRPDFTRMMNDVDMGLVNLVITKDLSRLGRDYIETGRYIEKIFPAKNIRYIAVNDNVDTFDKKNSNNDITPFKSVMNDMYAKDISNKVRTSIYAKAHEGESIKAFLPYGYKKDKDNKNVFLIDEDVAENVAYIFKLYISGKSKTEIARTLNSKGIITPLEYKMLHTNYFNPNSNKSHVWNSCVINKILRDRIYTGDLVQLKYNKVNYKLEKIKNVPLDEQIIIPNHHCAIIDKSTFNAVQNMLDKKSNEWNYSNRKRHLLSGLAYCSCGSRISYNLNHGKIWRCVCSSYKRYGNKFCTNIHLREDELINAVVSSLKKNINQYLHFNKLNYNVDVPENNNKAEIQLLNKKLDEINKIIANLYEDKISGIISNSTFNSLIQTYEKKKEEYNAKLKNIQSKKDIPIINSKELEKSMKALLEFNTLDENNISLVFKLIDKIIINDKKIEIKYKFRVPPI